MNEDGTLIYEYKKKLILISSPIWRRAFVEVSFFCVDYENWLGLAYCTCHMEITSVQILNSKSFTLKSTYLHINLLIRLTISYLLLSLLNIYFSPPSVLLCCWIYLLLLLLSLIFWESYFEMTLLKNTRNKSNYPFWKTTYLLFMYLGTDPNSVDTHFYIQAKISKKSVVGSHNIPSKVKFTTYAVNTKICHWFDFDGNTVMMHDTLTFKSWIIFVAKKFMERDCCGVPLLFSQYYYDIYSKYIHI